MSEKESFVEKFQAQLNEFGADFDKLRARAQQAGADTQAEVGRRVDELKSLRTDVEDRFQELRHSGEDAWDDLKARANTAWDKLSAALKDARSRFD